MINYQQLRKSITENRNEVIGNLINYLPTDVLLFWSDKTEVYKLQRQKWQPLLKMLSAMGLDLKISDTLEVADNAENKPIFDGLLQQLDNNQLTVCYAASSKLHSVLLGYLLAQKHIDAHTAFAAAYLEELYQNTVWGEDEQALKQRQIVQQEICQLQENL